MYAIEPLFSLVNSMTKSEKRYLRLVAGMQQGEKGYVRLFDLLDSSAAFDAGLRDALLQNFPGSSIEPARKHLYSVIIKSLRQFHGDNDIESRLLGWIQDSRILYAKGLQALGMQQLRKVKATALQHEKFIYYILAARQELQYLIRSQFVGITEDELIEKHELLKQYLEQETSSIRHALLYEILLFRYWKTGIVRNQQDITQLNDLLLEEYQVLNTQSIQSFESQQLHLHFQSIYFTMVGDPEGGLAVFRDLDQLFQRYPHLWENSPTYYLHLLAGILQDLRSMERFEEMQYYIERLSSVDETTRGFSLTIKYMIFEYQLQSAVDQRKIERIRTLIGTHKDVFDRETFQLNLQTRLQLQFVLARAWYAIGEYSLALKQINAILDQSASTVYQSLYVLSRLLHLQLSALLENSEYLVHAIRSVERKLKAERKLFGAEELILSLLKRWLKAKPVRDLQHQLRVLHENPLERRLIKELAVEQWIDDMKFTDREKPHLKSV